jgi:hypothetical protein
MLCSPDLSVVKGLILFLRITVAEPDQGQVNHLLEGRLDCNHRPVAISFTGPTPLGKEGDWVYIGWSGTCQPSRTVTETDTGPIGGKAWLCTADEAQVVR